jgi:hypothetical protein
MEYYKSIHKTVFSIKKKDLPQGCTYVTCYRHSCKPFTKLNDENNDVSIENAE